MSCACENEKRQRDYQRQFSLAKKMAVMNAETVVIYRNIDGTFGMAPEGAIRDKENITIIEYISPY